MWVESELVQSELLDTSSRSSDGPHILKYLQTYTVIRRNFYYEGKKADRCWTTGSQSTELISCKILG
jgi:hypothetical protein